MTSGIPTATYRLQFNKNFTFRAACAVVPYLRDLGISHIYASPYFNAGPDSLHGYDICDHNSLNPAIGTREDYDALIAALHGHGIGQLLDFVPNHMGISSPINHWWMDVLENGPSSAFAPHFDIDWQPQKEELRNKVLLPILGDQYGRVLERGELKLEFEGGAFTLAYYAARLPVAPRTSLMILRPALEKATAAGADEQALLELQSILAAVENLPPRTEVDPAKLSERNREKEFTKRRLSKLCDEHPSIRESVELTLRELEGSVGDARSFDKLDALLNAQAYRLSFWRVAAEEINHRRFFDINDLAAIRVELPEVFEATHKFLFELIANGSVNGLRIDHVDGLWDPKGYLDQLQSRCAEIAGGAGTTRPLYLLVEKILVGDEKLHADWPVHGTTGYDFMNEAGGLFVDPAAESSIDATYVHFTGELRSISEIIYQSKVLFMRLSLASEVNVLGQMLNRLSEQNRWYRDFTLNALTAALREVIACYPVYRTYLTPGTPPSETDRMTTLRAVAAARRRNPGTERSLYGFLGEVLLGKFPDNIDDAAREEHMRYVMKFQQCTGPVMAKGVEDTAFYIYTRRAALNEVGGEPAHFGITAEAVHARCAVRAAESPCGMLASSTHDTKRSEDMRARLAAISEMPALWRRALRRWRTMNHRFSQQVDQRTAPSDNEEYLLYQTILGTWPLASMSREGHADYVQRIQDYMVKAMREAKVNSSWIQPDEEWENAVRHFIAAVLHKGANRFIRDMELLHRETALLGAINSLWQLVLKATAPGVPDFCQGTELRDLSLVDPDNRRRVDFEQRRAALASLEGCKPASLFQSWPDGRIKLFITRSLLHCRRNAPAFFQNAGYEPLQVSGTFAGCCLAFARRHEGQTMIVIVSRLVRRTDAMPVSTAWKDTAVELLFALEGRARDIFTGEELQVHDGKISLASALRNLSVAVCVTSPR